MDFLFHVHSEVPGGIDVYLGRQRQLLKGLTHNHNPWFLTMRDLML